MAPLDEKSVFVASVMDSPYIERIAADLLCIRAPKLSYYDAPDHIRKALCAEARLRLLEIYECPRKRVTEDRWPTKEEQKP